MLGNIVKVGNYFGLAFVAVNKFRQSLNTLKTNDTILTEISKTSEMTKQQLKELGELPYSGSGNGKVWVRNTVKGTWAAFIIGAK